MTATQRAKIEGLLAEARGIYDLTERPGHRGYEPAILAPWLKAIRLRAEALGVEVPR